MSKKFGKFNISKSRFDWIFHKEGNSKLSCLNKMLNPETYLETLNLDKMSR